MYAESVNIYILVDPCDNEIRYVGKTTRTLKRRLQEHCGDLSSASHRTRWIAKLLRMGYEPIIQLVQMVDQENWKSAEQYWIGFYRSIGCHLTNGTLGGDGGNTPTPEARQKVSASKTGIKRKPFNDRWRARMAASHSGKMHTPETKAAIGAARVGKNRTFTPEWRAKLGSFERNKTHCKRGHEFTDANTRRDKKGKRYCRECDKIRAKHYRDKKQIKI